MKKVLFALLFVCFAAFSNAGFAQDHSNNDPLTAVLQSYFSIKNALVAGDSKQASASAAGLVDELKDNAGTAISKEATQALLDDASAIAAAKDLDKQRSLFAHLSTNMTAIAKAQKLSQEPVYVQYCPMKKASWLSNEKRIENPYYGSSMLTCGKVTETLQ